MLSKSLEHDPTDGTEIIFQGNKTKKGQSSAGQAMSNIKGAASGPSTQPGLALGQ